MRGEERNDLDLHVSTEPLELTAEEEHRVKSHILPLSVRRQMWQLFWARRIERAAQMMVEEDRQKGADGPTLTDRSQPS